MVDPFARAVVKPLKSEDTPHTAAEEIPIKIALSDRSACAVRISARKDFCQKASFD
jgi:hypothetical protein